MENNNLQFDDEKIISLDNQNSDSTKASEELSLEELPLEELPMEDLSLEELPMEELPIEESPIEETISNELPSNNEVVNISKQERQVKKAEKKQPYKNMKARKIVLLVGFSISFVGFGLMLFSLLSLLLPNNYATIKLFIPIDIAACATSFAGAILAVAGANTKKSIARLSFFCEITGFVISAAMLVIMYTSQLLPLEFFDLSFLS